MDIYVGNITAKIIEHNDLDTNADRVGPLLEHLDVSRNRLTKLPSSLGELTSCTTVLAEFNQIKAVPLLTSCVSLTTLSLDGNSLQKGLPYQRDLKHDPPRSAVGFHGAAVLTRLSLSFCMRKAAARVRVVNSDVTVIGRDHQYGFHGN